MNENAETNPAVRLTSPASPECASGRPTPVEVPNGP